MNDMYWMLTTTVVVNWPPVDARKLNIVGPNFKRTRRERNEKHLNQRNNENEIIDSIKNDDSIHEFNKTSLPLKYLYLNGT